MAENEISRYCMRCSRKAHAKYGPSNHETNEHDEWLARVMTEKTTPELPHTLAAYEWPGIPGRNELVLEEYSGNTVVAINRFEPCDEHEDADDHDRPGGLCFVRGYNVPIDPAELMRNLAAFVPEVEPVAWMDPDRNVWSEDPNEAGDWKSPAYAYARDIRGLPTPVTALYAHPPVTAEPAREHVDGALDALTTGLLNKGESENLAWGSLGLDIDTYAALARSALADLAAAGYVVAAEPATAPSVEQIEAAALEAYNRTRVGQIPYFRAIAEAIHALYGTPGDAGEAYSENRIQAVEAARAEARDRAEKAEARVQELETLLSSARDSEDGLDAELEQSDERVRSLRTEVERCKAALEAGDELIEAEHAWGQSKLSAQIAIDERIRREHEVAQASAAYSAARAAVEAETSEEA